jgi:hypothetical protein
MILLLKKFRKIKDKLINKMKNKASTAIILNQWKMIMIRTWPINELKILNSLLLIV